MHACQSPPPHPNQASLIGVFFFSFSGLVVFHDLSWFACTHLTGLLSQWLSRVTNSDLLQTSLFYSYLLNYTFSLYLNLTVLPFFSQAASYLFIPPTTTANRTMTTRHRCTVPPSTATLGWCGCCWRNSLIPPWGITSLRLRWTWQHCTAAWRLSNCCSVPILICSAATPRNTHHYTWPLATDTYP